MVKFTLNVEGNDQNAFRLVDEKGMLDELKPAAPTVATSHKTASIQTASILVMADFRHGVFPDLVVARLKITETAKIAPTTPNAQKTGIL